MTEGADETAPRALERLIDNLRVEVEPFAICEVSDGWRLRLSGTPWVTIHYVLEGEGTVRFPDLDPIRLHPCALVVMPAGLLHVIEHAAGSSREEGADCGPRPDGLLQLFAGPDGERDLQIICGRLNATYGGTVDIFGRIAEPVMLDFADNPVMTQIFDRLLAEQDHPTIGTAAVCQALMNECVIHILRRMSEAPDPDLTWLAAIGDPQLAGVIDEMLGRPEAAHTVESLASRAAMSRSTFHERFTRALGTAPITFLREVRLRKAADMLRTTNHSIDEITRRVGFSSRSHFSHAFTELFDKSPTEFRSEQVARGEAG